MFSFDWPTATLLIVVVVCLTVVTLVVIDWIASKRR